MIKALQSLSFKDVVVVCGIVVFALTVGQWLK